MFLKPTRIITIYLVLLIIAIPWYWPDDSKFIIFGFPAWVFVAILSSFFTSVFTAFLLLRYPWNMDVKDDE